MQGSKRPSFASVEQIMLHFLPFVCYFNNYASNYVKIYAPHLPTMLKLCPLFPEGDCSNNYYTSIISAFHAKAHKTLQTLLPFSTTTLSRPTSRLHGPCAVLLAITRGLYH